MHIKSKDFMFEQGSAKKTEDPSCKLPQNADASSKINSSRMNESEMNRDLLKNLVVNKLVEMRKACKNPETFKIGVNELKKLTEEFTNKFKTLNDVISPCTRATEFLTMLHEIRQDFEEKWRRKDGYKKLKKDTGTHRAKSIESNPKKSSKNKRSDSHDSTINNGSISERNRFSTKSKRVMAIIMKDFERRKDIMKFIEDSRRELEKLNHDITIIEKKRQRLLFVQTNSYEGFFGDYTQLRRPDFYEAFSKKDEVKPDLVRESKRKELQTVLEDSETMFLKE